MRAIRYDAFGDVPYIAEVAEPACPARGAVIRVLATGVCRSDWHAWAGHDDSVRLPHIPGHEFAGVVEQVAPGVTRFRPGDRVTAPFILACGTCEHCRAGATHVCPNQRQPGFTLPGSFAELVAVTEADLNLVPLPESVGFAEAAALGCRFSTAYHALHERARVQQGEWVAVFGCGGVGLSAVMVAVAAGARVVAVDVSESALDAATELGASAVVRSGESAAARVRELTSGGSHVALDALGSSGTCRAAIASLRPRGRHVQVGLLLDVDAEPRIPMGRVIADELVLLGSHGIAVGEYEGMLTAIVRGELDPQRTIARTIGFDELPEALVRPASGGMTVALLG